MKKYLERVAELTEDSRAICNDLSILQKSLFDGAQDHFIALEMELSFHFGTNDTNEILTASDVIFTKFQIGDTDKLYKEDKSIVDALETFRGAVNQLCGENYAVFLKLFGLSCGYLAAYKEMRKIGRQMPRIKKLVISQSGKKSVSNRKDIQFKQRFVSFCERLIEDKKHLNIRTINDLLDLPGYEPDVLKYDRDTLKGWAKKAGIRFKPGRQPKNNHQ
jgi:hypothetical protein